MKIFDAKLTREADNYTIKHEPISSIDLMERAANAATEKILCIYPEHRSFVIFAGPGNNGGDGLVIARLLAEKNITVRLYIVKFTDNYSNDFKINLKKLTSQAYLNINEVSDIKDFPKISEDEIIIDAIFGSGLTRILSGFPQRTVSFINEQKADIIAIDIPSGLFGEENFHKDQTIINADHTITFQYPSLSFLFPENEKYVGQFHIVDIGIHREFIATTDSNYFFTLQEDIKIKRRSKFSHKGTYGHAMIIAGSKAKAGASILAARAAHRSGAGLVTAHVPACNSNILNVTSPETMLYVDSNEEYITNNIELHNYDSVGIGPGIGFDNKTKEVLFNIIENFKKPIVLDADALTILSEHKDMLEKVHPQSILTPHPKEFERLFGKFENDFQKIKAQIDLSIKYNIIIVLKGAHTSISVPDGKLYFNSVGNPGMASGGSGDVLTGILTALLAQGYKAKQAAITGVYLHGKAADLAAEFKGQTALTASDIIDFLPDAFKEFEQ